MNQLEKYVGLTTVTMAIARQLAGFLQAIALEVGTPSARGSLEPSAKEGR